MGKDDDSFIDLEKGDQTLHQEYLNEKLPSPVRNTIHSIFKASQLKSRAFFRLKNHLDSSDCQPTYTKRYPIHPHLRNRVFLPPSRHPNPPLYIDIHGGGWVLCDPSFDDAACTGMAADWDCLVVSLDYSKSPGGLFPVSINEIADLVLELIADKTLSFDRTRITIGGFSAGANLALGAVQDPRLRGKITSITPFYPICDWSLDVQARAGSCSYAKVSETDSLLRLGPVAEKFFNYVYCKDNADLRDGRLSPGFANRAHLPEYIFTTGAEYDILSNEAGAMMGRLAGKSLVQVGGVYKGKRVPTVEGLAGDEKWGFVAEGGKMRWRMFEGIEHGWTHEIPRSKCPDRERVARESFRVVGEFLWEGPWRVEGGESVRSRS